MTLAQAHALARVRPPGTRPRAVLVLRDLTGGGAERAALNLAAALPLGQATVVAERRGGELADTSLAASVIYAGSTAAGRATRVVRLARLLRGISPDVVVSLLSPPVVTAAGRLSGVPVIHWLQNPLLAGVGLPRRTAEAVVGLAARRSAFLACPSPGIATEWQARGFPAARLGILPNPIGLEPRTPRAAAGWPDPVRIISIGRLEAQKRHDVLLEAVALVRGRRNVSLQIVGAGPLDAGLRRRARTLNIGDCVTFEGFVGDPQKLVAEADLFVLASDFEGFGNVLVEALGCGTPVVATDAPYGARFILEGGRYGRLVPLGEAQALAEAIEAVLSNRPPDEQARALLRQRAEAFSPERVAQRFGEIVDAVLARDLTADAFMTW